VLRLPTTTTTDSDGFNLMFAGVLTER